MIPVNYKHIEKLFVFIALTSLCLVCFFLFVFILIFNYNNIYIAILKYFILYYNAKK